MKSKSRCSCQSANTVDCTRVFHFAGERCHLCTSLNSDFSFRFIGRFSSPHPNPLWWIVDRFTAQRLALTLKEAKAQLSPREFKLWKVAKRKAQRWVVLRGQTAVSPEVGRGWEGTLSRGPFQNKG